MKAFTRIYFIWGLIAGVACLGVVLLGGRQFEYGAVGYLVSILLIVFGLYGLFFRYTKNIFDATKYDHINKVKNFLDSGVDINIVNKEGLTPLHHAICLKKIRIIEYLLSRNADVQAKTADGKTIIDLVNDIDSPDEKGVIRSMFRIDIPAGQSNNSMDTDIGLVNNYKKAVKCTFCGRDFRGRLMPILEFIPLKSEYPNIYQSLGMTCKECGVFFCESCIKAGKVVKKTFGGVSKSPCPGCGKLLESAEYFIAPK